MKLPFLKSKSSEGDVEEGFEETADDVGSLDDEPEADEEELGEPGDHAERVRRWAVVGAASVAGAIVVAITAWWLLSGQPGDGYESPVAMVIVDLPLRPETDGGTSAEGGAASSGTGWTQLPGSPESGLAVSPVTASAFEGIPAPDSVESLQTTPDPALLEQGPHGPLPRIGENGRRPLQAYARPFEGGGQHPRVSLIIVGLGLSTAATDAAILRLPGSVTLAFDPYASDLENWASKARRGGHEFLLGLPMEPNDVGSRDPGPKALMTSLDDTGNRDRLHYLLSRVTGYAGVIATMGSRFVANGEQLRPVLEDLRDRGLLFVDALPAADAQGGRAARELGLPRVVGDVTLDAPLTKAAVTAKLNELEAIARRKSVAVGVASPYPVTLEAVAAWIAAFEEKNLILVPVTALADKQIL